MVLNGHEKREEEGEKERKRERGEMQFIRKRKTDKAQDR